MLVAVIYTIRFYNTSELKYVSRCRIRESPETIVDRLNGKYDEQKNLSVPGADTLRGGRAVAAAVIRMRNVVV